jgi:hypothetical protein
MGSKRCRDVPGLARRLLCLWWWWLLAGSATGVGDDDGAATVESTQHQDRYREGGLLPKKDRL